MLLKITPEIRQGMNAIDDKYIPRIQELKKKHLKAPEGKKAELLEQRNELYRIYRKEFTAYLKECEEAEFKQIKGGARGIVRHAQKLLPRIISQLDTDLIFATDIGNVDLLNPGTPEEAIKVKKEFAIDFIKYHLRLHISALSSTRKALQDLYVMIVESVRDSGNIPEITLADLNFTDADIEELQTPALLNNNAIYELNAKMYHGDETDVLLALDGKSFKSNTNGAGIWQTKSKKYTIEIYNFNELATDISINTDKLLRASAEEFTRINGYNDKKLNLRVNIPFEEYARANGYEIDAKSDGEKEKKRAAEAIKNTRKRIKKDLKILQAMHLTNETNDNFRSVVLFQETELNKNYISLMFSERFAKELKKKPITQVSKRIFAIDARTPNAYKIAIKLNSHYCMYPNHQKGTQNRLKVSTILAYTDIPTYQQLKEEVPDDSRHWERRIKEPFEKALDALTGGKMPFLNTWQYTHEKGKPLTEDEAYNITNYDTFSELFLQFELVEPPDLSEALEKRAEGKKKQAEVEVIAEAIAKASKSRKKKPEK